MFTEVHIFGDAIYFCPNYPFLSQITYKQQAIMLRLKHSIVNKSGCLHANLPIVKDKGVRKRGKRVRVKHCPLELDILQKLYYLRKGD